MRGVRRETGGGRWAGGARRVRGGERSHGRWRRARAARAHFWTSRPRQIGHAPAGCALVHGEVGGVCRSRLLVPCVVDSTRPASSALHSPGRFTPPMREHGPRRPRRPPRVQPASACLHSTRSRATCSRGVNERRGMFERHKTIHINKTRANPTPRCAVTRQIRPTPTLRQLVAAGAPAPLNPRACTPRCREPLGSSLACRWLRTNRQ